MALELWRPKLIVTLLLEHKVGAIPVVTPDTR